MISSNVFVTVLNLTTTTPLL